MKIMLLEFKGRNYKSFKDEFVFSLIPTGKKGLDYSIMEKQIDRKKYKGLSSAVIYGPNASGKTNIISAMDTFKKIILRGHINNITDSDINASANNLELIPNVHSDGPTFFEIKFTTENYFVDYSLEIDLGSFLDEKYERKVVSENLIINNKSVFNRSFQKIEVSNTKYLNKKTRNNNIFTIANEIANYSAKETDIFLTNGFKTIFNSKLVSEITNWFENNLKIFIRADAIRANPFINNHKQLDYFFDKHIDDALNEFGVHNSKVAYKAEENNETRLVSIIEVKNSIRAIPADFFESYGTQRFINEFPLILSAFKNGGTLIVDEFDASLHPMALMSIINAFHNDELNINHAQLIFNTHNPIFLNHSLFRRDEIKFVEFENDTSVTYSLSDFNTSETSGTRTNSDYMKNYFVNRYGAISDIDFSDVIASIVKIDVEEK